MLARSGQARTQTLLTAPPLGLYVHIPFCQRKCPYCDFNTYAGLDDLFAPFTRALAAEILRAGEAANHPPATSLFLGGGTPTVLPIAHLAAILDACRQAFALAPDAEITCEANPGVADQERFAGLRALGVNRLSMGVQSFDPDELAFLGRIHSADQAEAAFHAARAAGFTNINLDLIYGLPRQSPADWLATLERALALGPEHLSLYALTIEEGTPFAHWAAAGRFSYPDDDLAADLYEAADERLRAAGYVQYEISNWARSATPPPDDVTPPDYASRHNLLYWRRHPYLGFGPGAHAMSDAPPPAGRRWWNVRRPETYIARVTAGASPEAGHQEIDARLGMAETMALGLRLTREGVAEDTFRRRWGITLDEAFGVELARLVERGLIERLLDRVRLTARTRLVANQAFVEFMP